MSKFKDAIPKVGKIVKAAWKMFWEGARHFPIDAGIVILCIVAVIYWLFNPEAWMEGAVAILIVYAIRNVIRFNDCRKEIDTLKKVANSKFKKRV